MNAGLSQDAWQNLTPAESNSRQLRWQGERAQLQQAANFQEAHNDNLATIAFADGLWVMYDYNRGYAPDIESSGCMDIFRLPKFSYHFFRSKRPAAERLPVVTSGPMVFIASDWTSASATDVRVFSNCDEVALYLNGRLLERKGPDQGRMSTRLAHPPFTFRTGGFRSGTLEAVGYIAGRRAARHVVRTPGAIDHLTLAFDLSGRRRDRERKDDIFCYAAPASVHALAIVASGGSVRVLGAALALEGSPPTHEIRYSTDGGEPGPTSILYRGAALASPQLRAGLLVHGRVVASLAADTPKFRIPASAAPDRREPFRR